MAATITATDSLRAALMTLVNDATGDNAVLEGRTFHQRPPGSAVPWPHVVFEIEERQADCYDPGADATIEAVDCRVTVTVYTRQNAVAQDVGFDDAGDYLQLIDNVWQDATPSLGGNWTAAAPMVRVPSSSGRPNRSDTSMARAYYETTLHA